MRTATHEEYLMYWQMARFWYLATYHKEDYECIGSIAEYMANKFGVSLYNQSLPIGLPPQPISSKMSESEYDWKRDLKYYRCNTCKDNAILRWYDILYGDATCSVCGRCAAHIPYKEYLEREDL